MRFSKPSKRRSASANNCELSTGGMACSPHAAKRCGDYSAAIFFSCHPERSEGPQRSSDLQCGSKSPDRTACPVPPHICLTAQYAGPSNQPESIRREEFGKMTSGGTAGTSSAGGPSL